MKYAYIEITENCNLACPFCPSPSLDHRGEMPLELFEKILHRLQGNVSNIFLHVLGEPLLHARFPEILSLAEKNGFCINLTTNGTLIRRHAEHLLSSNSIRQINFSTHAYAYLPKEHAERILDETILFAKKLSILRPEIYLNFRLWNAYADDLSENWNLYVIQALSRSFQVEISLPKFSARHKSVPVFQRIYLHRDSRFTWPEGNSEISTSGTCHGIIDQCAVLFDGTVVPCCLDYRGNIPLGKFPENSFEEIFQGEEAQRIASGFFSHKLIHPFCQKCSFVKRFP